jgi:hypothetical protein
MGSPCGLRPAPGTCRHEHEHHPACWRWRNKREPVCVRAVTTWGCQQTHCHRQLVAVGSPSALPPCFAIAMVRGSAPSGQATRWREDLAGKEEKSLPDRCMSPAICLTGPIMSGWENTGWGSWSARPMAMQRLASPEHPAPCDGLAAIWGIWAAESVFHSRRPVETCGFRIRRRHRAACSGASSSKPLVIFRNVDGERRSSRQAAGTCRQHGPDGNSSPVPVSDDSVYPGTLARLQRHGRGPTAVVEFGSAAERFRTGSAQAEK